MGTGDPPAIGVVRETIFSNATDLHELAREYGYRMVYTVYVRAGLFHTMFAIARHAAEHAAQAIVMPDLEHAEDLRQFITDNAALITSTGYYPRGYDWEAEWQPK